jgi:hypothetical protein
MEVTPTKKRFGKLEVVCLILVVLGAMILVGTRLITIGQVNNEKKASAFPGDAMTVFDTMVESSLSTGFMTEQNITRNPSGKQISKVINTYDLTDMSNVRIFGTAEGNLIPSLPDITVNAQFITVPEGTYMSYKKLGDEKVWQGWFPLVENGVVNKENKSLYFGGDPRDIAQQYLGFYIPGTYPLAARKQIKSYFLSNNPYEFFSDGFKTMYENNKKYYTYDIKIDPNNMLGLDNVVANALHTTLLPATIENASIAVKSCRFWINPQNSRLERVNITLPDNYTATIYYYDYKVSNDIEIPLPNGWPGSNQVQPTIDKLNHLKS